MQADHLDTARVILNNANVPVWRWDNSDAFGLGQPNQDPDGDGTAFEYNPRLPGQYYDKETGLHYNHHRYYDPQTGRYITPDPIGLAGGLNPYVYVGGNPVNAVDPFGLTRIDVEIATWLASATQTDLNYPEQILVTDLSEYGSDVVGATRPGVSIRVDDRYDQPLSENQANDLLDTVIHESVHYTYPKNDFEHQLDFNGRGFPYEEALRRTTRELKREFNKLRKIKPKDRKKELDRFLKCNRH